MRPSLIFLVLILFSMSSEACTDFRFPVSDASVWSARTMDFPITEVTQLRKVAAGTMYRSVDIYEGVIWTTTVNYLSFTSYGVNKTVDGLNGCGLSCALLTLTETEYQKVTDPSNALGMTDICDWVLGQFCKTGDVKENLKDLEVYQDFLFGGIPCPLLHMSIHDDQGSSLVVEFLKGYQVYYDNPVGVLTNDPTYDWHMKNLQNYDYVSNVAPLGRVIINSYNVSANQLLYSVSSYGLPADDGPVSRFIRIAQMIRYMSVPSDPNTALIMGAHLLEKVAVIPGFSMIYTNKDPEEDYYANDITIYRIIRDHTSRKIYFSTFDNLILKMVDVGTHFETSTKGYFIGKPDGVNYYNITNYF